MTYLEGVRYKRINALSIAPYIHVHVLNPFAASNNCVIVASPRALRATEDKSGDFYTCSVLYYGGREGSRLMCLALQWYSFC